jgi:hypothetical protein
MTREDIEQVTNLDRRFFGLDRGQKLRRVRHDYPELCFKASKGGEIRGYIMAKPGASNVRVGPWICDPKYAEFAEPLLNALSSRVDGRKVWVGLPEFNKASIKILGGNTSRRCRRASGCPMAPIRRSKMSRVYSG